MKSAILYGSETLCLGQNEIGILQRTERAMVRNLCGVELVEKKLTKDLMQMLGLSSSSSSSSKLY